ncbi:MAG: LamG domain-containing protein, partial [Candidatus Micrarchaeaceae archaeon]
GDVYLRVNSANDIIASANGITPNAWSHVVGTWNGSYGTVYINGALAKQGGPFVQTPSTHDNGPGYIGYLSGCDTYDFNGLIADVQVYNGSLSSQQAYQLYSEGSAGPPVTPAPNVKIAGWWPLNGNANDYSGKGNSGTTYNVISTSLYNYPGNPLLNGAYANVSSINKIAGVLNCGTLNQCSNSSLQHLYLASLALTGNLSVQVGKFNGASSYVSASAITGLSSTQTVSLWVYPASFSVGMNQYLWDEGGNVYQLQLYDGDNNNGKPKVSFDSQIGTSELQATNVWYNIVGVSKSDGTLKIYINGVLDSALTGSLPSPSTINIGRYGGNGHYTNGSIANVQAYNTNLTAPQISQLYAAGLAGSPVVPANIVGWWPLNGTVRDYSGNGNSGTNNGIAYITAYTNRTNGTSTEPQAFHLGDAIVPNVASFDGADASSYIHVGDLASVGSSSDWTVSFWMYSTSITEWRNPFDANYAPADNNAGPRFEQSLGGTFKLYVGSSVSSYSVYTYTTSMAPNTWYHVVAERSSGYAVGYLDGVQKFDAADSNWPAGFGNVTIGRGFSSDAIRGFNGSIADVQVYNTSLSQAQVNQLYTNDSVIGVKPAAWFPLDAAVNGLMNETPNLAFPNKIGYFGSCTSSNVINSQCGVREVQP